MGVYAAWLARTFDSNLEIAGPTPRPDLARTLLIADFEPPPELIDSFLGGIPRVMALAAPPRQPLPNVAYGCFRTATNPLWFDEVVHDAFRHGIDTVAFLTPPDLVNGKTLLWLHDRGVKQIATTRNGRTKLASPRRLAWRRLLTPTRLLKRLGLAPAASMSEVACRRVLAHVRPPERHPGDGPLKIAHFVCSLNSGGAERQVCHAAIGQKNRGHEVRVLCRVSPVGIDGHYLPLLVPHGIPADHIGAHWSEPFARGCRARGLTRGTFDPMPPDLRRTVADLVGDLLAWRPDVLHCYVDDCNIPGAIAALLAGVPAVVLSFRNGNPSHFPGLEMPWMKPWYRVLRGWPGVAFASNSAAGARDYERWLGWPQGETPVVRNAFDPPRLPSPAEVSAWRASLGIAADAPLVAGVGRLSAEKRPLQFLDCVDHLRRLVPGVRVVTAGVGELEAAFHARIDALGLRPTLIPLGQRRDIPTLLAASDVLLLTSSWEGTPNVVLEAQHCGCVPVVTEAGGSREALDPGVSGVVVGHEDFAGAVAAMAELLADRDRRQAMARAGRAFVRRHFAPEALDEANLRMYRDLLGRGAAGMSAARASSR